MATEHDVEALRSLLSKLDAAEQAELGSSDGRQAKEISTEALKSIERRLKTFIGEDFVMPTQPAVDEEGLPIMEFTEPVTDYRPSDFIPPPPELVPMPKTEEGKAAFRKARDAFLDALEEEERQDEERSRKAGESEFMKAIRIAKERVEEVRTESNTRNNSKPTDSVSEATSLASEQAKAGPKTKKTVSFVETDETSNTKGPIAPGWGSIQQGRLRTAAGVKSGSGVMKLQIIERVPAQTSESTTIKTTDSDDEDSGDDRRTAEGLERSAEAAMDDLVDPEGKLLPSSSEGEVSQEESDEKDEADIDDAIHHREVALRYHELRHSLGKGPQSGALGGPIESMQSDDEWDQENVPLEAHLREEPRERHSSKFIQSRISRKAMDAVLPGGLQGQVKYGTVVNNQLLQGNDESDEELNERGKRIIEGLTKGLTVEETLANEKLGEAPSSTPVVDHGEPERMPPKIKAGNTILGDVVESSGRRTQSPTVGKPIKVSKFKANRLT